jgi:hypothetical protein
MWLAALIGWLDRQEREAFAYFFEETVSCARIAGLPTTSAGTIRRSTAPWADGSILRARRLLNRYERAAGPLVRPDERDTTGVDSVEMPSL